MRIFERVLSSMYELLTPVFFRPGYSYSWSALQADAVAGVTVALIQVPQAMAFALTAGLPAVYGLYASIPGFIASIWGSSKHLSTGPVAVISLLTLTSLVQFAEPGSAEFISLAALLAILVGLIYFLMGVFRLGSILHFVPETVVVGFSSAAAGIIVISQLPTLFGVTTPQHELVFQNIIEFILKLPSVSLAALVVGCLAALALVASKRLPKVFPGALVVLATGIAISYVFKFDQHGIALVANIPSSLPTFSWPSFAAVPLFSLIPKAGVIALVGFVQAHATAKIAAAKTKDHINTDQELVGQGLANIVTGFFSGFPISGSFTRTAVNVEAGAKTSVASIIASGITIIALLFFTPLFYFLPKTILAAIVIVAAIPLIDYKRLCTIYRMSKLDGYVAFLTFSMAFLLKPDDAIFIGVVAALMIFLQRTTYGAKAFEMGADREWNVLRRNIQEERVTTFPGVCIVRTDASLYYANAAHLVKQIEDVLEQHAIREKTSVKTFVLDSSSINLIDVTATEILADFFQRQSDRGVRIAVMYLRAELKRALEVMPGTFAVTVLHNINELKQYCMPQNRTLVLSGPPLEYIQRRKI